MKEFKFLVGYNDLRWPNTRHEERRVFRINVGDLPVEDLQYFIRQLQNSLSVPVQYFDHLSYISSRRLTNEQETI
jgi:hypothetical protein